MKKIIHGDCLEIMRGMGSKAVDMVLTSPPYDNLRDYNNSLEWGERVWQPVLEELYRVIKEGGVCIWVVGDSTIKGSETGTSFKQALYAKEIGFNLHDTMIYQKQNYVPLTHKRYEQSFEYMFVFSKGAPITFNAIMVPTKYPGKLEKYGAERRVNHGPSHSMRLYKETEYRKTKSKKISPNIFSYTVGREKTGHPAVFPDRLARDCIMSWSNEGDIVLDPFAGSGTTAVACEELGRNYIMIEKEEKYVGIMKKRLREIEFSRKEKSDG